MIRSLTAAASALALSAGMSMAGGDALILANGEYDDLPRLSGANRVLAAAGPLEEQGIDVVRQVEGTQADMEGALRGFLDGVDADTDRVAVILSGRFAHSAAETYLLPVDLPAPVTDGDVLTEALPMSAVLAILADYPGQAVLMIAEEDMDEFEDVRFLRAGSGQIDAPQGVSVVRGSPREIERLARRDLATPSRNLAEAVEDAGLDLEGYAPPRLVFIDEAAAEEAQQAREADPEPQPDLEPQPDPKPDRGEARLWESVKDRDDIAGYETYLSAYPDGPNARVARDRLESLRDAPRRQAEETEAGIGLNRTQRQEVQSDLTTLGYDTRGVDGIFGPGSRSAIESWQTDNDAEATGYLTAGQVDRIAAQSRRAQEEQAAREAEERDRQERAERGYWRDLGDEPTAQQLNGYLERFPNGIYEDEARARLERMAETPRERAALRDRDAFVSARDTGTVEAYRRYIDEWPNGAFVERAENRIARLQQQGNGGSQGNGTGGGSGGRAEAEEAAMNLPRPARAIAEQRLAAAGADPGTVDGVFDSRTRQALRAYQQARGIPVTGYLDNATATRLLAETVFGSR